ncbi:phage integrase (pseudogene) [Streptococcus pneumoniae]|nr:phage integrase (pseudogene) [Streptococcus pneumoniae]
MDNARFHRMGKNVRFHRMGNLEFLCGEFGHKLLPLPPYSPEYNPIEKTWAHIKKPRKRYYQVAIPFTRLFCLVLVSIDYINCLSETTDKNWHKSDRIFVTNTRKPAHSSILSKSLQRANERLKKPIPKHLSPHIFRHTTISILSENKIPLKTITDRVGHSDSEVTTSIYTHVTKNMKDEAINVLDKVMKKIF